jgi:peptide/nickel transport system substrate-binding protein
VTRSSRHPWRWFVALAVALSMIAVACGDDDTSESSSADEAAESDAAAGTSGDEQAVDAVDGEGEPVAGGTLIVGLESEVDGLNPANNAFDPSGVQMGISVFDTLAVHTEDGETVPFLAESFTPNEDFTEWTITLREGVTFHDGTPFDAAAVEAAINATLASPLVSLALLTWLDPADAVEVVDDSTVIIKTKVPTAHFPSALTAQLGMMPSPTWLAAIEQNEDLAQEPVGTGPFEFESRVQDEKTVFVRNEDWWGNEVFGTETYLDRIEFHPVANTDTRTTALLTGAFKGSHTTNPDTVQKLREEEEAGNIHNLVNDTGEEEFVMINTDPLATDAAEQAPNPFRFLEARRALALATPKERYLQVIGLGELEGSTHMFHPSQPFYVEGVVQAADDPDAARAIVEDFCADSAKGEFCSDGKINMQFKYVGGSQIQDDIADVLTGAWSDAGFNVDITNTKQDSYITEVALNQYQVVIWRQFGAVDPDSDVVVLQCESIGVIALNFPRWCDEERDGMIQAQRAAVDEDERKTIWADIVRKVNEASTYVFLTHTKWVNSYDTTVKGLCSAPATPDGDLQRCTVNGRTPYQTVWIDPA